MSFLILASGVCAAACRILYAFKLNPYEQLNLRFTATPEEIRKQYRKISLMVHPDKCKHEKASEAFEGERVFWHSRRAADVLRRSGSCGRQQL
jgi:preprotein translocase subunit Sec63